MEKDLQLMRSMRFSGHILYHYFSLKDSQSRLVFFLHKHGSMTQKELMTYLNIKSGSLSELVGKVEKNGLLEKVRSEEDKRNFVLKLTPLGVSKAIEFEKNRDNNAELLFACLSEEEKNTLQELLDKIMASWKQILKEKKEEKENV